MFNSTYYTVDKKRGVSPFQNTLAYLGGSAIQTVVDNPVTAYRQLVQQYAKNSNGIMVSPSEAIKEANKTFTHNPFRSSVSGLAPRLVGVLLKRIPKFGFLLGYDFVSGGKGEPGVMAATAASILSAPFINPVRMIEKQQRVSLNITGKETSIKDILKESARQNYKPLFRGTVPLMGHSLASALLGLVGQPKLQKYIQNKVGENTNLNRSATNLLSSSIVSPIYVVITNPLSRLEVIMQTSKINGKSIGITQAIKELSRDMTSYGMSGIFRGQGVGMFKAVISLTLFHEGRLYFTDVFKESNN